MKVAFVSYDFGEYSIRIAGALAEQGCDVMLLLPEALAAPHLGMLNPRVRFRPFAKPRYRQALRQIPLTLRLVSQIRRFDPDVIHLQQGHMWFNLALPLLSPYPLVVTIHDPKHHLGDHEGRKVPQGIMEFGFRRAAQLIVQGSQLKEDAVSLGLSAERIHMIPMVALGDDGAQRHVQEAGREVLFFGRIWEYKGLEYLIKAEPLITQRVPDARIVIAGEGEDFERYRKMMVHPDAFTVFNEYVSEEKAAQLFRRASLVVLPYVDASQSAVIPVAYTYGKPVVATTVGGLPDLVDHGVTGYLVPPRDEVALANSVVDLLMDEPLRRRMGARGKAKIEGECSPEVVAKKTVAVYRQATGAAALVSLERRAES